jgi:hypothetical protein
MLEKMHEESKKITMVSRFPIWARLLFLLIGAVLLTFFIHLLIIGILPFRLVSLIILMVSLPAILLGSVQIYIAFLGRDEIWEFSSQRLNIQKSNFIHCDSKLHLMKDFLEYNILEYESDSIGSTFRIQLILRSQKLLKSPSFQSYAHAKQAVDLMEDKS